MIHQLNVTGYHPGTPGEVLPHMFATCSCGWRVSTTLGVADRSELYVRKEMFDHVRWMNDGAGSGGSQR